MEKSLEEIIFETKEVIKQVISESGLNVSIAELILHNLYLEIHDLSKENLRNKIVQRQKEITEEKGVNEDG